MSKNIKKSVWNNTHIGNQPIRVLTHNIIKNYENTNPYFLELSKKTMLENGLQPGISYYLDEEPVRTPYVDENKKIAIHETFLSYLWINCYSSLVLYDEAVAKPMQNAQAQKKINIIDADLVKETEELFQYSKSLIKVFASWDKTYFPNPEEFSENEEFYILRANSLFIYANNFILCHEYAHIEMKHINEIKTASNQERKKFEKQADERAIKLMLDGKNGVNDKSIDLGILIGLASLLFFKNNTDGGETHPDTDDRIKTYLEKLNLSFDQPIWGSASLFFKLWDNQFDLNFNWPKQVNDFKEMFYNILEQIEKKK